MDFILEIKLFEVLEIHLDVNDKNYLKVEVWP